MKGGNLVDQDEDLLGLVEFNPLEACNTMTGSLPDAQQWASPMRQGSVAIPARLPPDFQSDGTMLTPLGYAPSANPPGQMPWPMHGGEAREFDVTGGNASDPVCGSSLEDMWRDEGLQGTLSFPMP
jgi:hypothetical protein